MKSTHRRNEDLMQQAVLEAQTSIERVKVSLNCSAHKHKTYLLAIEQTCMSVSVHCVCLSGPCVWPCWCEKVLHVSVWCVL